MPCTTRAVLIKSLAPGGTSVLRRQSALRWIQGDERCARTASRAYGIEGHGENSMALHRVWPSEIVIESMRSFLDAMVVRWRASQE